MELYKSSIADITPPFMYSNRGRCIYKQKCGMKFETLGWKLVDEMKRPVLQLTTWSKTRPIS